MIEKAEDAVVEEVTFAGWPGESSMQVTLLFDGVGNVRLQQGAHDSLLLEGADARAVSGQLQREVALLDERRASLLRFHDALEAQAASQSKKKRQ